jgi:hypothetical protein
LLRTISFLSLTLNIWVLDREFGGNLASHLRSALKNRTSRQKNE